VIRSVLAGLNLVSLRACVSCAEMMFRRPPRHARSSREKKILSLAKLSWLRGRDGDLAVWVWGSGPRVLLAHGWGGHSGRLVAFVPALLKAGWGVVAFDAPAHGLSGGRLATLPDFAKAVSRVAAETGPVALIGHSMGAAACALAIRSGLDVRVAVLLAPPADPEAYTVRFARYMRLSAAAARSMGERLQTRYGVKFGDLRLAGVATPTRTLVIHDRRDARVPVRDGIAIAEAWPRAELVVTRGLGHHRILRDRRVVRRTVRFLAKFAREVRLEPVAPAPGGLPGPARFLKGRGEMAQSRASLRRLKP
jgi:pimeloyl-ACP methyl ester carboxylesterase